MTHFKSRLALVTLKGTNISRKASQFNLDQVLNDHEEFWKEKACINWHLQGDHKTNFFHLSKKIKRAINKINSLTFKEGTLHDVVDIENLILNYFTFLSESENSIVVNNLIGSIIPSLVTQEDNLILTNLPSIEEMCKAIFSMNSCRARSHYGFGGHLLVILYD